MTSVSSVDRAAVGFSLACIVHCLALPVIAISLPILTWFAEAEWVHWLFAFFTIASSIIIMAVAHNGRSRAFFVPALIGIGLLLAALVSEPFGIDETLATVLGGLLIAAAHIYRLLKHS